VSTLMTERRRPLDDADGQESLFGGEAFALTPGAPVSWQRPAPAREDAGRTANDPREAEVGEVSVSAPLDEAQTGVPEASVRTPVDESHPGTFDAQPEVEYESGPSAEDLAAYAALDASSDAQVLAGPAPTEVPAHGAGVELEALERATIVADDVCKPRAPLAGPTLDDMMSRVWEGLATGMPAACPVCHGEVVTSFAGSAHGSCSSCGTTIE
jgi:hypothetical protein